LHLFAGKDSSSTAINQQGGQWEKTLLALMRAAVQGWTNMNCKLTDAGTISEE